MKAQLAKTATNVEMLLASPEWSISQKLDGHRVIIAVADGVSTAMNRDGIERDVPLDVFTDARRFAGHWCFDGELIGSTYFVFDLIVTPFIDAGNLGWAQRYQLLEHLFESRRFENWQLVTCIFTEDGKRLMYDRCIENKSEGVMFKHVASTYRGGRSSMWLKHKFVKSLDCVVISTNDDGKDNLTLGLYQNERLVQVGRVSALTGDGPSAKIGDVVEVQCLYATPAGSLYQPTRPIIRLDKRPEECDYQQMESLTTNKSIV